MEKQKNKYAKIERIENADPTKERLSYYGKSLYFPKSDIKKTSAYKGMIRFANVFLNPFGKAIEKNFLKNIKEACQLTEEKLYPLPRRRCPACKSTNVFIARKDCDGHPILKCRTRKCGKTFVCKYI